MRWLALIVLIASGTQGFSQVKNYPFLHLTDQDGLPDNAVNVITKDHYGFIWFGTGSGLAKYDGYSFKVFRHDELDSNSVGDERVVQVIEGPDDKLYLSTASGAVNIFDPPTGRYLLQPRAWLKTLKLPGYGLVNIINDSARRFYFIYSDSGVYRLDADKETTATRLLIKSTGLTSAPVASSKIDVFGNLWLSHLDGVLERLNMAKGTITFSSTEMRGKGLRPPNGYLIYPDRSGNIWIYGEDYKTALWKLDPGTGRMQQFCRDSGAVRLSSNNVLDIVQDEEGILWIATEQGGVNLLDPDKGTIRYLQATGDERSLPENTVTVMCCDGSGGIWLGTGKTGACYFQPNLLRFPLINFQPALSSSLPYNDVISFAEDGSGNLWIGTDGGGLIYFDRSQNKFTRFRHDPNNANTVASDVVISLLIDKPGRVWLGTYMGGLDCYDHGRFIHYRHNPADSTSLADDRVYSLKEERPGYLWVGTLRGGLDRFEIATKKFYHNTPYQPHSILSIYVPALANDSAKNLWIGTAYGIDVLSRNTGQFTHYSHQTNKLSDNVVNGLTCDHSGNMWVATYKGLNVIQADADTFQTFRIKDGLPSNFIYNILEDKQHFLWVSTSQGLSRVSVSQSGGKLKISCINFDEHDGLQGRAFNRGSALITSKGELIFGGPRGFNMFRPESIRLNTHIPQVALTGIQVYNTDVPLPASLDQGGQLTLSHDENNFTLEFAALSFVNSRKNRYAYQLEGFDKTWMTTDGRNRRASYTNISPGEYTFRVRASNSDGVWNDKGIAIRIIVRPPWWATTASYILYFLLAIAILYLARRQVIRRARTRFALAEERREARRIQELDQMKIKFLTNISHEFRTPLSLILSPADRLIHEIEEPGKKQLAFTIEKNARRLLRLVNQLLDLRKMEVNELRLHLSKGDIAAFIQSSAGSFADLARERGITFSYHSDIENLDAYFDKDKVERIIFNLLSNALKFTPLGGSVSVGLSVTDRDTAEALLELTVTDTGVGIRTEQQDRIFESFFQGDTPPAAGSQGTGIGLAITREFVEMHGGTIKVNSTPDKGSRFTVLLPVPLRRNQGSEEHTIGPRDASELQASASPVSQTDTANGRFKVLLVEDDDDFRFYLKDNLSPLFTVIEASNGREAWQKILSEQPDLVISDVNMPEMDGLELAKKIKTDGRTEHIPVVLLTALSAEEDQLRALEAGANDYISKPFNLELLISRVRNLLRYRQNLQNNIKGRMAAEPKDIDEVTDSSDADFVKDAVAVLQKNIANPDFSVDEWSREMGLSRTTMYKRIIATTGKTPIGFIRTYRMNRAAQLLEKTRHNVAEIAYMVGYNNPKYFASNFKEVYGVLPSVYQADKRKKK